MPLTNGTGLQHAGEDSSEDMVPQIDRLNYMQVVVVFLKGLHSHMKLYYADCSRLCRILWYVQCRRYMTR